ncbi:MAG: serine acetyltransferase [Cyclobacteriaceae bacterium]|nr:serine acetyltransferase [Cyclobacteriaceae bacterium]
MNKEFLTLLYKSQQECPDCPSPEVVANFFVDLLGSLFPDHSKHSFQSLDEFEAHFESLKMRLEHLLLKTPGNKINEARKMVDDFFEDLPTLHTKLNQDISAIYEEDPAAKSHREVVRTYPGFYAIAAYRIAHGLHTLGIHGLPRTITEHAHSKTGIDIHPGAKIGNHFCIDHGTGVVIGETTIIGNHVKLYQGVTLGALSINKADAHIKRHPTIEDQVIIYAGATILGGSTLVGHNSVIGGNVWLTQSVPPYSKIYYQAKTVSEIPAEGDFLISKNEVQ